jgi:hypothetical protein
MTTRTTQSDPRGVRGDGFYATIEAHGQAVAMGLLWVVPVLVLLVGLVGL